jgi:hypothetical protein
VRVDPVGADDAAQLVDERAQIARRRPSDRRRLDGDRSLWRGL